MNDSVLEHTQSFIQRTHGVCGGNARLCNTRMPVWTLVAFHQDGMTDEELLYNYPSLSPDDLATAWGYYQEHQSEIDQVIADQDED